MDTLRAAAIVGVVICHLRAYLPGALAPIADVGWMGVDLFFVLSGYLIGLQLLRPFSRGQTLKVSDFYIRRAYRILPAYLVVLLLYFAVPVWREYRHLPAAWKLLTFTANLAMNYPQEPAFSHVWSLCIEEHFYLLLPLLVIWRMRRPSLVKTAALIGSVILFGMLIRGWELFHVVEAPGLTVNQAMSLFVTRIYDPTYARLDGLVTGMAIALTQIFRPAWWERLQLRPNLLLAAGLLTYGSATWLFRASNPSPNQPAGVILGFPLLALGFGLLVISAASARGLLRLQVPGVKLLATLAFSLYLTHKEVAHMDHTLSPWMAHHTGWLAAMIYAVTCLAVAGLLYLLVERPFLLLRDRHMGSVVSRDPSIEARLDPAL